MEVKQKVLGTSLKDVEVYEIHTVNSSKNSKTPVFASRRGIGSAGTLYSNFSVYRIDMNIDNYNFTASDKMAIRFLLQSPHQKVIYWKEYGSAEWYTISNQTVFGHPTESPVMLKMGSKMRTGVRLLVKLGLLIPEIEDDKEYKVQRALGLVIGRIYYMPDEIRKKLKDLAMDL